MKKKKSTEKKVLIYDTTLRDGTQAEGISLSLQDKIAIAKKLDQFGVHYIEGGWPGSNPKDLAFFKEIRKAGIKNAKIAAFGSTRRMNIKVKDDAYQDVQLSGTIKDNNDFINTTEKRSNLKKNLSPSSSIKNELKVIEKKYNELKKNTDLERKQNIEEIRSIISRHRTDQVELHLGGVSMIANDTSLQTSIRWLCKDKRNGMHILCKKICRSIGIFGPKETFDGDQWKSKIIFWVAQFIYTMVTLLPGIIVYHNYWLHLFWLCIVMTGVTWNGASFYIEVFAERYTLQFADQTNGKSTDGSSNYADPDVLPPDTPPGTPKGMKTKKTN